MKKRKVIIDTDPGVDDANALIFALNDPVFDIKLLTVANGNIKLSQASRNLCHLLDLFQKDIPVVNGYEKRFGNNTEYAYFMHGEEGLGNYTPPKTTTHKPEKKDCADAMYEVLKQNPHEVTIIILGPHTNLGYLLLKHPDAKDLIKDIVMATGAPDGIKTNPNYCSFNMRTDAPAFEYTQNSGKKVTMCPSRIGRDVTYFTEEQVEEIKNSSILGKFLAKTYETYWEPGYPEKIISNCDLATIYTTIYPRLYKTAKANVTIDTKKYVGKLTADYNKSGNFVIVKDVKRKKFQKMIFKKFKQISKISITNKTFLKNMKAD